MKYAISTGKGLSVDEKDGARFLRRLPWTRAIGNGRVDLFTRLDLFEIRVLVFLMKGALS